MNQRNADRDPAARAAVDRRVGLYIDFDSMRHLLEEGTDIAELAARLRELAQEHGRVLLACAYADWTGLRNEARDFHSSRIETRIAYGPDASDDSTAVVLSLDALETLYRGPEMDIYLIASGDQSYDELVSRLQRADRIVVLTASEAVASGRTGERFVPLEELLGGRRPRRAHAAAPPSPAAPAAPAAPRRIDFSTWDWTPFVKLMDELEANMPFVGFGWLLKKKLNPENSGCYSLQEKQDLMDHAVEDGLLTLYKVDNIEERADPVTACKLNREHAVVREILG